MRPDEPQSIRQDMPPKFMDISHRSINWLTLLTVATAAGLILGACSGKDGGRHTSSGDFPESFRFGVAMSGFQADMGCPTLPESRCLDDRSDWYSFVTSDSALSSDRAHLSGDMPSSGPGFWELYRSDIERVSGDIGLDALRYSIEWSRLFPTPTDDADSVDDLHQRADARTVDHYDEILTDMRDSGVEPWMTLNHYTLPVWLHAGASCHIDFDGCDRRGWLDRERLLGEVRKYARFVGHEYGDQVDHWMTLNEPLAVVIAGYLRPSSNRTNPPAVQLEPEAAKRAWQTMVLAHIEMYEALKAADTTDADGDGDAARVGVAYNFSPVRPADPDSEVDRASVDNVNYLYNFAFTDAIARGRFDRNLDGEADRDPRFADHLDFIGVNYYGEVEIGGLQSPLLPDFSPLFTVNPLEVEIQYNRPEGVVGLLKRLEQRYELPMVITENGTTAGTRDTQSPFLVDHLRAARAAIDQGVDLRGYFFWTLMDNYEWNHGLGLKMGMYRVDFSDSAKPRRPRPVVQTYRNIAETHRLPGETEPMTSE